MRYKSSEFLLCVDKSFKINSKRFCKTFTQARPSAIGKSYGKGHKTPVTTPIPFQMSTHCKKYFNMEEN